MGLHHPDWHDSVGVRAWCRCGTWCSDGAACDCCELVELRAEVETLRAQVEQLSDAAVCEGLPPRFDCDPSFPLCDDEPCQGHRLTPEVDLVARVLAIKEGWDRLEDSDQTEDYWRTAAELIAAIEEAQPNV